MVTVSQCLDQVAPTVHYRRAQRITPASRGDEALDILGIEPSDIALLLPLFSLVAFVLGCVVGFVL